MWEFGGFKAPFPRSAIFLICWNYRRSALHIGLIESPLQLCNFRAKLAWQSPFFSLSLFIRWHLREVVVIGFLFVSLGRFWVETGCQLGASAVLISSLELDSSLFSKDEFILRNSGIMGNGEADPPAKASKSSDGQVQPPVTSISPATPVYLDWSTFQAYSPLPPPGFLHSAMVSRLPPHPYVWGAQHLLPPYGTPPGPPPYILYPHGGIYAHPSIAPDSCSSSPYAIAPPIGNVKASGAVPGGGEAESKPSEGKEESSIKTSKGRLSSLKKSIRKNAEFEKTSGASGNEAHSQSGDSVAEASSVGSDADSPNDSAPKADDHQNSSDATTPQSRNPALTNTDRGSQKGTSREPSELVIGHTMSIIPPPVPAAPFASPTTNLDKGKGVCSATNPSPILPIRSEIPSTAVPTTLVPGAPELEMQDAKELKRQRRKMSNRESAKRSRLRKQAEYEKLAHRVEVLSAENILLKAEVNLMKKGYEQLYTQYTLLKGSMGRFSYRIGESNRDKNEKSSADDGRQRNLESVEKGEEIPMKTEELVHDENEKASADDDRQQNLESDVKGEEISKGTEELIHDRNEKASADDDGEQNLESDEKGEEIQKGTEELIHDRNEKASADDDDKQNLESDEKGKEAD